MSASRWVSVHFDGAFWTLWKSKDSVSGQESQPLVTDEQVEFGKQLNEVQNFRELLVILEEYREYTLH